MFYFHATDAIKTISLQPSIDTESVWYLVRNQRISEGNDSGDIWQLCSTGSKVMSSPGWTQGKMLQRARAGQWVSFASVENRARGNGTSVMCQRLEEKSNTTRQRLNCPKTKGKSEKIELLNSPIYSLKVSYAWGSLQVASIISQHLSLSLNLFHFLLYFLHPALPSLGLSASCSFQRLP